MISLDLPSVPNDQIQTSDNKLKSFKTVDSKKETILYPWRVFITVSLLKYVMHKWWSKSIS